MYIQKYKPENLEDIIGNKSCIISIQKWFEDWYVKHDIKNTCALLSGPNGIGKTLLVELLIKKYDLNHIVLNPDERADKEYILKTIIPSIQRTKSFTNKQNIFVIHDVDCYDDYGFISSIVACLKETKIPVIATCNQRYDQSLKPILPYCLDIKFQKPIISDILKFVKPILKKEFISISDAKINQIIDDANCDIRNVLNNLQLLPKISNKNIAQNSSTKDKINSSIFEVTKEFMSQSVELDDKHRMFWTNNDILPLMIFENYPANNIKMKNEALYLNNIAQSIHSLSDIDLFEKDIHMNGNWELMPYTPWFAIKATTNCHPKTMIKFTSFFEKRILKKQTMHYDCHCHDNSKTISKMKTPKKDRKTKIAKIAKPKNETSLQIKQPKQPKQPKRKVKLIIEDE